MLRYTRLALVAVVTALALPVSAQFQQQGSKLVGTGASPGTQFGIAAALSGDGKTAVIGDWSGGIWVFTNTNGAWSQQGSRIVGYVQSGNVISTNPGLFGSAVAVSADGDTLITGGIGAGGGCSGAWIYIRSNGVWSQQGPKLVGSSATATCAYQGYAVALSADGNTALVGGPTDTNPVSGSYVGAAWVFTRVGGVWTQQGSKLVASDATSNSQQGISVALSADGNTAMIGGLGDNGFIGAAWIFTRTNGVWTQQGPKLAASDGLYNRGGFVALSGDGNTALLGSGFHPNYGNTASTGPPMVFTRSNGVWAQQGPALTGASGMGSEFPGGPVALSGDGNTALLGAFVFSRIGSQWIQQSSPLVGSGATGLPGQGTSLGLSSDGKTALVGGPWDNGNTGAAWVFAITAPKATPSMAASSSSSLAPYTAQPHSFTVFVIGNATVGAIPTGALTFLVDGIAQSGTTAVLSAFDAPFEAIATFYGSPPTSSCHPCANVPPGSHTIQFTYSGDATYNSVTGGALNQVINHGPTSTVVSASTPTTAPGQLILSASVTGPWGNSVTVNGGTVTFTDSVRGVLGTQPLVNGSSVLALPLTTFTAGVRYSITATYSGSGDANSTFDPSVPSPPLVFTFHQYAPVITIASTSNPAVYGGTLTFTATVAPSVPGAPMPTGTVSFLDNSLFDLSPYNGLLNAAGQASITVPYAIVRTDPMSIGGNIVLSGGGHVMSVTYSGDANYVPANNPNPAASLNQQIAKSDTITVLSSSQTGQIASLTATVSPASLSPVSFPWVCASNGCSDGRPSGSVQFWSDSTFIGTAMLTPSSATASSATVSVSAPPGSIRVVYYGDANYNGSNYPAQTPPASVPMSSVIITADPISPTIGQPVTFAVSVVTTNGTGPANGTVQFFDGLKPLGTARVSSGTVLLTATLGLGSHTISATYSGDATYPAASQTMGIYVTRLSDSLSLTSNTSTTASGQSITFTARLAWQPVAGVANPSGKVQFFAGCLCGLFGSMINRTLVGTAALSDSVATVTIGNLPDSSPQVAAVYDGDDSWSGTKSNPLTPARK